MTRPRFGALTVTLRRAIGFAAVAALAVGGSVLAASAAPSAAPQGDPNVDAWVDQAIDPQARAGTTVSIGITMWDRAREQLLELSSATVRLRPARGSAPPSEAKAKSDWPGHLFAHIDVPRGGPGAIEVLFEGEACADDGTCTTKFFPFGFGGFGPPPDAPRSLLVVATILTPRSSIPVDVSADIVVDVVPKAAWDPAALGLPETLVTFVSGPNGPDVATATLYASHDPRPEPGLRYSGQIRVERPGVFRLFVAIPGNRTEDQVIGSVSRFVVTGESEPSASPGSSPDAPAPVALDPPWPLILGGIALVVVAGVVIRTAFADL
jgi:hypothetical protein